jgi:RNA polymerase sigma-70 factor, ECF subfamily
MLNYNTTDSELVRMCIGGDNVAFSELVRRHDRAVFGLISRYVACAEDAKDIYQDVFIRVHRNIGNFRFNSQFSTWLYRVTVNMCIDHAKKAKRSALAHAGGFLPENPDVMPQAQEPESPSPSPDQESVNKEIGQRIRTALDVLPPRQRMVFVLRHEEGRPLKEIACALGCREGTVKRYLFEATRTMRKELCDLLHA